MKTQSERDGQSPLRKQSPGFVAAALLLGLGGATPALAQFEIEPILRVAWDYDDNAGMSDRTDEEEQISGVIGEASVDLRNTFDRGLISLRPTFRSRQYEEEANRDSDDTFVDFRSVYNGERNSFRLFADYDRESVRTAELANAELDTEIDPEDIPDDDSGQVSGRERRERMRGAARWSFQLSDVSSIEAGVNHLDVAYGDRPPTSNLFDYTDTRFRLSYARSFSPRLQGVITGTARNYNSERQNADQTGVGVQIGITRDITETTQFRALFGVEDTDTETILPTADSSEQNIVGNVSLVRNLETTRLLVQYRQRIAPSGRGGLTRRDEFNLRFMRDLNDRFTAGLGVRAYTRNTLRGDVAEQDFVQLRGQVMWRISQAFSMQADYRYTVINRELSGEAANSNQISVWFSWHPLTTGRVRSAVLR